MSAQSPTILILEADANTWPERATVLRRAGLTPMDPQTGKPEDADLVVSETATPNQATPTEFLTFVRQQLRLQRKLSPIQLLGGKIDLTQGLFITDSDDVPMTPLQVSVLELLLDRVGRVITREELFVYAWGTIPEEGSRAVDQLIHRLRRIVERDPSQPDHLIGIRGIGYRLLLKRETKSTTVATQNMGRRHNLPVFPDQYFGRKDLLGDLIKTWDTPRRLLTLLGPGGIGKSRLATELTHNWVSHAPGGAWFCDLINVAGLDGILDAIATPLGIEFPPESAVESHLEHLTKVLADMGDTVIVLDNCERTVAHVRTVVTRLRKACPDLRILATSREKLRIRGERTLSIQPLHLNESVELFHDRAGWDPAELTDVEHDAVEKICAQLDQLPLAIELAAARAQFFGAVELKERLSHPFKVLRARSVELHDRQRSLEATLRWSWDLLAPWERSALEQVAIFRTGFSLHAAESVVDLSTWPDAPDVEFVLEDLIDKSLVHTRHGVDILGRIRFGLLTTVQNFASGELVGSELLEAVSNRFSEYFARFGDEAPAQGLQKTLAQRHERIVEMANIAFATQIGPTSCRVRALEGIFPIYSSQGPFREGVALGQGILTDCPDISTEDEIRLRCLVAQLRYLNEDRAGAVEEANAAQALVDEHATPYSEFLVALAQCRAHISFDQAHALAAGQRAVALARTCGQPRDLVDALFVHGVAMHWHGLLDELHSLHEEALALAREHGLVQQESNILANMGAVRRMGDLMEAVSCYQAAVAITKELGIMRRHDYAKANLGAIFLDLGRYGESEENLQIALQGAKLRGISSLQSHVMTNLGILYRTQGRCQAAIQCLSDARQLATQTSEHQAFIVASADLAHLLHGTDSSAATTMAEEAMSKAEELQFHYGIGAIAGLLGEMASKNGEAKKATALFKRGDKSLKAIENVDQRAILFGRWAEAEIRQGRMDSAAKRIDQARQLLESQSFADHSESVLRVQAAAGALEDANIADICIEPPQTTATLVFTDIVGTTQIWEALGTDFEPILALHDKIVMRHARRNQGYLVKNSGDSFFLAFEEPAHGVRFALDVQRDLQAAPWPHVLRQSPGCERGLRVRIGLHSGPVQFESDGTGGVSDYLGPTVNMAARITRVSDGTQCVLSDAILSATESLLSNAKIQVLPNQKLKGFEDPVTLHAIRM